MRVLGDYYMSSKTEPKVTIKDVLSEIDARIAHIEDATCDNREVLMKLVKQTNQIVKFLNTLEVEEEYDGDIVQTTTTSQTIDKDKLSQMKNIKELVDEYMKKAKGLKEFEKELKKVKIMLTPGQMGEA